MRCKKHYADLSSIVGVCASCLRERLFSLVAAQEQAQAQAQAQAQIVEEIKRNSETIPVFPRSVSPYISRRKSDNSATSIAPAAWSNINQRNRETNRHHSLPDQRFFSTPQVGPTTGGYNHCRKKQHSFIRFSLLSNLFRSKKRNGAESDLDPVSNSRGSCGGGDSATSSMSSPSWFSSIKSDGGGRKKHTFSFNETSTTSSTGVMRKLYCPDRGMSPVRYSDACGGEEDEFFDGSSGYESCESRKQTPWRTPAHPSVRRGGGGGNCKNISGLTFCLSPLVRASPNRQWNQKGMPQSDVAGEIRTPVKPHLSNTKSFCANRSRKLADFGRFNTNR